VFWWGVGIFTVTVVVALLGLLHWVLTDPDTDRDIAKDRFRLEQEYRELRRAGK
jgi:hypothetical protein